MDREVWRATVHGVAESEKMATFTFVTQEVQETPPEFKSRPELTRHTFEKPQEFQRCACAQACLHTHTYTHSLKR